jgi:galactonate dehydratase
MDRASAQERRADARPARQPLDRELRDGLAIFRCDRTQALDRIEGALVGSRLEKDRRAALVTFDERGVARQRAGEQSLRKPAIGHDPNIVLWDVAAKAAGQPLYRLLGGKFRDRIRLYADCGDGDDSSGSPEGCAARAQRMVKEGFTALKFDIDDLRHPAKFDAANHTVNAAEVRSMVERVSAVRKAIGPDIDLCIDLHARYDVPSACRIAWEMEPFNLMWLEEPIPAENVDALRQVRARSRTPICVGENLYLRWGFRELLQQQAADVIMPDVPKCGGLAESKKIANLAEIYYLPFAPHLVSTPLGTMATCHVCAAVPNLLVLEWHALEEREIWDSYVFAPDGSGSIVKDGHIALTDQPGIGLELNMENVRKHAAPGFGVFE